jgi:hypothetical protein
MARRTNEESLKYWGRVVREHRASGLSIRQFCEVRKIVQTQFYTWRKRLAESAALRTRSVPSLLPVTLVDAPSMADGSRIEIRIDGSVTILVRTGFDADTLCQVVRALRLGVNGETTKC